MNGKPMPCLALMVFLTCAISAWVEVPNQSLRQDDLVIYYGVLPAELLSLHELNAPGTPMSGRDARRPGAHHVRAALFDAKTGQRIQEASVSARTVPLSGAPEVKALSPCPSMTA
ncbi:MAG: hypothetical protein HYV16_01630 [Gammaproteobacteria bacterium]|nr:hypothetical protein [Gammaproteobacteria bacterium]